MRKEILVQKLALTLCLAAFSSIAFLASAADPITLNAQQISRLGIKTELSLQATDISLASVPAKIIPVRTSMQAITVPFDGVLTKIHVLPTQAIKAGQTLFTVRSRDYLEMKIGLDGANSELETANTALTQQKKLVDEGLAAGTTLLPLTANVTRAQMMADEHKRSLQNTYGAGAGQYYIKASAGGRIEDFNLQVGQSVKAMSAVSSVFTSNDLWVEVQVPSDLVGQIGVGDLIGFDDGSRGEVISAARTIDPKTKSAVLVANVPPSSGFNPGQLTKVNISKPTQENGPNNGKAGGFVRVPVLSIIRLDGVTNVFRQTGSGFEPIEVTVEGRSHGYATISSTLAVGDKVAVSGLTELKAISLEGTE